LVTENFQFTAPHLQRSKKIQKSKEVADQLYKGILHTTRKQYSAEQKKRIMLAGLRDEERLAAFCRP
jgi:transposase